MQDSVLWPTYKADDFKIGEAVYWNWNGYAGHMARGIVEAIHKTTIDIKFHFTEFPRGIAHHRAKIFLCLREADIPQEWRQGWINTCDLNLWKFRRWSADNYLRRGHRWETE